MPQNRYYTLEKLRVGDSIEIGGKEFHHLSHVMRRKVGDPIEVVNGQGILAQGKIQTITRHLATITISQSTKTKKDEIRLILAQAIPKQHKLEFVLEKCTELGISEFWLFPGEKGERNSFSEKKKERAEAILIAAMKQSGRLFLPSILILPPLSEWAPIQFPCFFGDTSENAPYFQDLWDKNSNAPYPRGFVTGPEGGFSKKEEELLSCLNIQGVKLSSATLRTETASIIAAALMNHWSEIRKHNS